MCNWPPAQKQLVMTSCSTYKQLCLWLLDMHTIDLSNQHALLAMPWLEVSNTAMAAVRA